ncbi:MAG: PLP-dependent aminotransferase family protein [Vicinamibacterales bacterium]
MRTPITIDRRRQRPLHRQIYDEWRRGILAGRFVPGERMPSTRELAAALRVSRATVTAAYEQLVAEGYLDGHRGSGTFVRQELPDRAFGLAGPAAPRATSAPVRLSAFVERLGPVTTRTRSPAGVIDLFTTRTDQDLFPFGAWGRIVRRHLRRIGPGLRGHAEDRAGHAPLREAIASYLRRSRAVRCEASQVVIVSGSQQALDLCARVLVDPGDEVVVEEPGYPGARQLFAAAGARLRAVHVDVEGLLVATLPSSARLAYVTPSHQFPLGVSLSLARRLDLLAWARARRAFVIEDDYDSEFRYVGAPLPALQGLGDASRVVYVGTLSNAMFPGLRIGYVVLPPALVEPFVRAKWYADRQTAYLEQAALADFIGEGHLEQHIRRMRRVYKARREALLHALDRHFGPRATVLGDAAGLHLVVRFEVPDIAKRARKQGVALRDTRAYYLGRAPDNEFILGFSDLGERALGEAIRRLAG